MKQIYFPGILLIFVLTTSLFLLSCENNQNPGSANAPVAEAMDGNIAKASSVTSQLIKIKKALA